MAYATETPWVTDSPSRSDGATELIERPAAVPLPIDVRVVAGRATPPHRRLGSGKLVLGAGKDLSLIHI